MWMGTNRDNTDKVHPNLQLKSWPGSIFVQYITDLGEMILRFLYDHDMTLFDFESFSYPYMSYEMWYSTCGSHLMVMSPFSKCADRGVLLLLALLVSLPLLSLLPFLSLLLLLTTFLSRLRSLLSLNHILQWTEREFRTLHVVSIATHSIVSKFPPLNVVSLLDIKLPCQKRVSGVSESDLCGILNHWTHLQSIISCNFLPYRLYSPNIEADAGWQME